MNALQEMDRYQKKWYNWIHIECEQMCNVCSQKAFFFFVPKKLLHHRWLKILPGIFLLCYSFLGYFYTTNWLGNYILLKLNKKCSPIHKTNWNWKYITCITQSKFDPKPLILMQLRLANLYNWRLVFLFKKLWLKDQPKK